MKPAPSWYVTPNDARKECYWNGSTWVGATRKRRDDTPDFPADDEPEVRLTHEARMEQLAQQQLEQQTHTANYVFALLCITIVVLILGIVGGAVGWYQATH